MMAGLKRAEGKSLEAAALYEQALAILEKILGSDSPELAPDLNNLAALYEVSEQREKAEPLFLRAISLDEKALGSDSPDLATDLNNLGLLYVFMKRYEDAEKIYRRALDIRVKAFGDRDPAVAETLSGYITALRGLHRDAEALQMESRLRAITGNQSMSVK